MNNLTKLNDIAEMYGLASDETKLMLDAIEEDDEEYTNALYNFLIFIK